ncbi:tetratricopeptide repeat protein [Telluria aromaticivorans]|uniref:Tetratricopeptide repeat protein n=1 Tax=Telluria aromaticivorans TaxID=2725995 RepID=A0A7Y2JXJ3_9BURK|nr:tetratricopeptide repeat protein [Telluria aromaticivorans]NNG22862.1 tetratricopeptide repeat protein [Telluria aromaticivorans]
MIAFVYPLVLLAALHSGAAQAAPYIPASGQQVLERLPGRLEPAQRELARLRAELTANPNDLPRATFLARRYIEQARRDGDPRYLGYAQAALAPWWNTARAKAPPDVLVLRATLNQSTHSFDAALADLDEVVRRDAGNAQAWLTRATIQLVTGDYAGARTSCARLFSRTADLVVQTCLASVGSVSGSAGASYERLRRVLAARLDSPAPLRAWAATLLGEMAERLGKHAAAESHFREALAADPQDSYLLAAYADFLLERGRAKEVLRLLADRTLADALLLRYAIALKTVGSPDAVRHTAALRARFEAAQRRGDVVHRREEARFALALDGNPAGAVRLAKLNWAVQKEPADLRILAQAAAGSGDAEAARLVQDWVRRHALEDRSLDASLRSLGAAT